MARTRLSPEVIAERMVELRNLRKLHATARAREIRKDARITELEAIVATQQQTIEKLLIQVSELQTMVFGRKKHLPAGGTPIGKDAASAEPMKPRTKDSYRRPIPPASSITEEVAVPLPETCTCGGSFDPETRTTHECYQEDIPLPELTPDYQAKLVTKYLVARGICQSCGKATSGRELGGAKVSLGSNVRLLVTHLIASVGMSYAQVVHLMLSLYGLHLTDGEIANMLKKQHQAWLPAYHQLSSDIRASPVVHADETSWPIQSLQGAGYAWDICDAASDRVCFVLASSRGAPHAKRLFGKDTDQPFKGVRKEK